MVNLFIYFLTNANANHLQLKITILRMVEMTFHFLSPNYSNSIFVTSLLLGNGRFPPTSHGTQPNQLTWRTPPTHPTQGDINIFISFLSIIHITMEIHNRKYKTNLHFKDSFEVQDKWKNFTLMTPKSTITGPQLHPRQTCSFIIIIYNSNNKHST